MDKQTLKRSIILFIAEGAYAGRFPVAPGTAGTAAAVLLYILLKGLSQGAYLAVCIAVTLVGTWAAGRAEEILDKKDHPFIVVDEVAGYLVSLIMVPQGWGYVVGAFFLFRYFDIAKPWPLRQIQSLKGGPGVMLDDIGAGVYTNIVLQIAAFLVGRGQAG
jgi:phosphatidylglycerophosphatase A